MSCICTTAMPCVKYDGCTMEFLPVAPCRHDDCFAFQALLSTKYTMLMRLLYKLSPWKCVRKIAEKKLLYLYEMCIMLFSNEIIFNLAKLSTVENIHITIMIRNLAQMNKDNYRARGENNVVDCTYKLQSN